MAYRICLLFLFFPCNPTKLIEVLFNDVCKVETERRLQTEQITHGSGHTAGFEPWMGSFLETCIALLYGNILYSIIKQHIVCPIFRLNLYLNRINNVYIIQYIINKQ